MPGGGLLRLFYKVQRGVILCLDDRLELPAFPVDYQNTERGTTVSVSDVRERSLEILVSPFQGFLRFELTIVEQLAA